MKKRIITLGEVLMRLTAPNNKRFVQATNYEAFFGGAEANVAVSLSHFGLATTHVTAFPAHDIGKSAGQYLRSHGVDTSHIYFTEKGRMGLYFLEKGTMQRASRIIYDRFESSFSHIDPNVFNWDIIFKDAHWLHWSGITPALSQSAAVLCRTAIHKAKEFGLTVSGDINYRRNLWQYGKQPHEVIPELIQKTDVVIAGLSDFRNCLEINKEDFEAACLNAVSKYPHIHTFATTHRISLSATHNKLSAVMWKAQKMYTSKIYELPAITDRIGGGDAFMAGLIYGLLYREPQQALDFAIAASVLKHGIPGDASLVTVEETDRLVTGENTGRLLR
ncbi:sugar kinase [Ascidiimonas aurantiaca]|uniref:sugar kinase n=1 Tax=Ascidiimonas aurantiaca TaxID=1685432 RepID=UPI0030EE6E11